MVDNIMAIFAKATPAEVEAGTEWYSTAHTFCVGLAERYGPLTVRQAAGIVAALSPQTSWERNLILADIFCRTGDAPTLKGGVRKAAAIAAGADPLDVLGGNKVRSFFDNIVDPTSSTAVTVDRHALAIADPDKGEKYLERKGAYDLVADAYRQAAALVGLSPLQLQAVTWLAHKRTKVYARPQHAALYQRAVAAA